MSLDGTEDFDLQQTVHEPLERALKQIGAMDDAAVLTGWTIVWEEQRPDGRASAGSIHGPAGMTTWRALGLLEWARRFLVEPGDAGDD